MDPPKACDAVRSTCQAHVESLACRTHVTINDAAIPALAHQMLQAAATVGQVQWDEENWHYRCPPEWPEALRKERIASYILALDAINFCFWPVPSYEYVHLSTTLTRMAQADHAQQQQVIDTPKGSSGTTTVHSDYVLSASSLETMSVETMRTLFETHAETASTAVVPPDLEQRCQLWNEVGRVVRMQFAGSVMSLIESAQGSAPALVQLLVDHFVGFQDHVPATAPKIHFYKRAQICVGDWNESLQLQLRDMDQLTTFADYRVPQLLRHHGVMVYSKDLAALIDEHVELPKNSEEELAIRACTVTAVERLVDTLGQCSTDEATKWNAVATDWYLWQVGERMQNDGALQPHHRVRTIFY